MIPLTDVDILIPATEGDQVADLFPEAPAKRGKDGSARGMKLRVFRISQGGYAQRGRAVPVCDAETSHCPPDVERGRHARSEHPAKSRRAETARGTEHWRDTLN